MYSCGGIHICSWSIKERLTKLSGEIEKCSLKEGGVNWSLFSRNMGKVFQGFIHLFKNDPVSSYVPGVFLGDRVQRLHMPNFVSLLTQGNIPPT